MEKLKLVTYCGLYCGLCSNRGRIPQQAKALRQTMTKEGYDIWGKEIPGFTEFWEFLNGRCDPDKSCPGCRQGGGPPFCGIRKCAHNRKVDICVYCEDYPCEKIRSIEKGYPTLVTDGMRIKEVGIDTWIEEQEKCAETGFVYADIRRDGYEIPME